jgi:hypothetical protein
MTLARHQAGTHIITLTATAQTFLVTVEHASTGQLIPEYTRPWATKAEAREMARNAYRWFTYRATLKLTA